MAGGSVTETIQGIVKRAENEISRLRGKPQTRLSNWPGHVVFENVRFLASPDTLNDYEGIKESLLQLSKDAGLVPIAGVWKRFEPQGVTGLILLETSHVAIHTWPEDGVGYLTLASCNPEVSPGRAIKSFLKALSAKVDSAHTPGVHKALKAPQDARVVELAEEAELLLKRWSEQVLNLFYDEEEIIQTDPRTSLLGLPSLASAAAKEINEWIESEPSISKGLRTPFRSWGGSYFYARKLAAELPEHSTYVEPFCGAASVFFAKELANKNVLGDADDDVIFALKLIKKLDDKLIAKLEQFDWRVTKNNWTKAKAFKPSSDLERFWRIVYGRYSSWSGKSYERYSSIHEGNALNVLDFLKFQEKLRKATVKRQDWIKTLKEFDSPETLFFIDPPYEGEWAMGEEVPAEAIAEAVKDIKGKFVVAYTNSDEARKALRKVGELFTFEIPESRRFGAAEVRKRLFASNCIKARDVRSKAIEGTLWSTTRRVMESSEDLLPHVSGDLKYALEDSAIWARELLALQPVLKDKYPSLRVPDPPYILERLKNDKLAGILSSLPRAGRVGQEQALINELKAGKWDSMFAWAIVEQGEPVEVGEFSSTSDHWEAVDESTRKEYDGRKGVFFLPLKLIEALDPPIDLGRVAGRRFGPEVEIKESAIELTPDPTDLQTWPSDRLILFRRELESFFPTARGAEREATLNAAFLLQRELRRRDIDVKFGGELGEAMQQLAKSLHAVIEKQLPGDAPGETAPVYPSGDERGAPVALEEVLRHVKPICLRYPCVALVGGVANQGYSKNDIDLLIRGPFDDETEHAVKFRLGRMFPGELSERIQFLTDSYGPFTNHVDLYDLWLVPRQSFELKEMSLDEVLKANPLLEYPKGEIRKHESTLQMHFRGASMHGDFRAKANDHLIGFTIAFQRRGLPDVNTIPQGQALARSFDPEGSRVNKPFIAPKRVFATPKAAEPVEWLRIAPKRFEPGTVGATAEEEGVIVEVDRPKCEWGTMKPHFHEWFLTKARKGFEGILQFRLLVGEDGAPEEELEAGRRTPAGQPFWTCQIGKTFLPSVLRKRAVETKSMPPDGQSAIPLALMKVTPKEFRYWEHKGAKAREVRDALVESKFFTESNVTMINGEFARIEKKTSLHISKDMLDIVSKLETIPYVLSYQYWRGQEVVRAGPTKEEWHLTLDRSDEVDSWALQANPLEVKKTNGIRRDYNGKALLTHEGDVEPGKSYDGDVLNPTKDTPSRMQIIDKGRASLLEDSERIIKLTFSGGELKGTYILRAEAGDLWVFEPSEAPGSPRAE